VERSSAVVGDGVTVLAEALARRIAAEGPLGIDDFMAAALLDPEHGYYTTQEPFGSAGDFVTAPEVSQMFGELIGLWCLAVWSAAGAPVGTVLAELGPGRGTLMADLLRAIESVAGRQPFRIRLVEASSRLRERQRAALPGREIVWHESVEELPEDGPLLVVANEFLDALPVRQFVATPGGWRERRLDWRDDRLQPVVAEGDGETAAMTTHLSPETPVGRVAELSPVREGCVGLLARRIARQGGAALLVDFTDPRLPVADTLQAVRKHRHADRFAEPGRADLAAAVDFAALATAARAGGARVEGPVGQGAFLAALGIDTRLATLARGTDAQTARRLAQGRDRLVGAEGMGEDFRVMAILPTDAPPADGFPETAP